RTGNWRKEFDGIQYYNNSLTEIKIPTWYGVDVYAGTETVSGQRTNPEETKGTISYVGVSLPLLQNLVMDKRRAALQQAKILVDLSHVQQASALNDLLRDGLYAYWEWWEAYHLLQLADSSWQNARSRFLLVKKAWQLGDRPAIDTIEALAQVQSFDVNRLDALAQLARAEYGLSAYLWRDDNRPYDLPSGVVPKVETATEPLLLDRLMQAAATHPEVRQYNVKLASLQVDKKLKFQSLLPAVDLKYNQLAKGADLLETTKTPLFQNNYRFGISLSVPLRLSAGRGDYQQAKLKIEQTALEQVNKQVSIQTKLRQSYTEWQQTTHQLSVQTGAVANYAALLRGEEIRFQNGESSLFFLNAREQKTLEARQKLVQLKAKNQKALTAVKWAAG
ncbi:MAG TPA: TolC family protein, partial [Flavisolibacter sp.]|nr:TolC family protein [Flavisolibacter sp.]